MAKSGNQTVLGKAFEYACASEIYDKYKEKNLIVFERSPQLETAKRSFFNLSKEEQDRYIKGAQAAIKIIDRFEPKLSNDDSNLYLSLQTDSKGISGDVRDIVCKKGTNWEIGISCKHNHHAVKHSRLSDRIDFGKEWFDIPCSTEYFDKIKKIFTPLRKMRDESKNSNPILWSDLPNKEYDYYIPTLQIFSEELNRLNNAHKGEIPALLVRYLIGKNDFYKVIMNDSRRYTQIEAVNINGTLNKSFGKIKALIDVPLIKLPTKFYEIDFKDGSNNTLFVVCDEGWNISFRIHNASSKVEPSLKFDVTLLAMPSSILTQIEPWSK